MDVETANGRSHKNFNSFESNIDYEIRYMVDCKVRGASWITIPKGKHGARLQKETTCSYECTVDYKDVIPHEPEGEWANIAPMRILRFVLHQGSDSRRHHQSECRFSEKCSILIGG